VSRRLERRLDAIEELLEQFKIVLMLREPMTGAAADAYEGLRKQVVAGFEARNARLVGLARLDAEVQRGASMKEMTLLLRDLLAEAALIRVDDPARLDGQADLLFNIVGGKGDGLEVIEPAYVDAQTHRTVRMGTARAVRVSDQQPVGEVADGETAVGVAQPGVVDQGVTVQGDGEREVGM